MENILPNSMLSLLEIDGSSKYVLHRLPLWSLSGRTRAIFVNVSNFPTSTASFHKGQMADVTLTT